MPFALVASFALVFAVGCGTPHAEARWPGQAAPAAIVNTTWAWTTLITSEDRPAIRIDEVGRYTLALQTAVSLHVLAHFLRFAGVSRRLHAASRPSATLACIALPHQCGW